MRRFLILFFLLLCPPIVHAWNGAGHRLSAVIAWQQLSPASRQQIAEILARHPDYPRWQEKSRSDEPRAIFAEAATWPDSIRHDPRYYDETRGAATPAIPGLFDQARHKRWHYVDLDARGKRRAGEIDRQIGKISQILRSTASPEQISWAVPWLLHLVGDIHQPLHVGKEGDDGGNRVEIENPARRQPFSSLHQYWDELPGPSSLRGKRLDNRAAELLARYPAPAQSSVTGWRNESHRLLAAAYPPAGSLLPLITEEFDSQARGIAERQIVNAGYRLGRLLEGIFARRVSRETP
ncbi:S1/P1 nuclease [Quatrionicoccus australiensis]|uniref:S1/P1 nuclease n=1 Tax=Quatrionicoccus australiensis TaxID=138118 RepID=UPI001CFC14F1|nr:S1/P1 nuclease [Quatrionicoccus australiensis]MCB4360064.1 S1/P1 nuclease [Quatrionicoccus australiensis]